MIVIFFELLLRMSVGENVAESYETRTAAVENSLSERYANQGQDEYKRRPRLKLTMLKCTAHSGGKLAMLLISSSADEASYLRG